MKSLFGPRCLVQRYRPFFFKGLKCRSEQSMTLHRLVRSDAAKAALKLSGAFGEKGRPHLEKAVRKSRLKNTPGYGGKRAVKTKVGALPTLFFAAVESPQCFGFFGAESYSPIGAKDFQKPGIA